ncbi:MAG: hypothetical protein ABW185_29475, partial [Sedimenticola sp.]
GSSDFNMRLNRTSQNSNPKRQRISDIDESCFISKCQKCDKHVDEHVVCSGCKLQFCLNCAQVSQRLYECILNGEMDDFHWNCRSCKSTFPSLQNITGVLNEMRISHDDRMTGIETRMNKLEHDTKSEIKSNIEDLKQDIIKSLKEDIDSVVDDRNKELEDRKRRELNIVIFHLPESEKENNADKKMGDESKMEDISTSLGMENLLIKSSFRLGKPQPSITRPLKLILLEKSQRKFLLDNAKFIPTKVQTNLTKVFIVRDLTPKQRNERSKLRIQRNRERPNEAQRNEPSNMVANENVPMNIEPMMRTSSPLVYVDPGYAFSQLNYHTGSQSVHNRSESPIREEIVPGEREATNRSLIQEIEADDID